MKFVKDLFSVYKKVGLIIIPISYLTLLTDQWLVDNLQGELMSVEGASPMVWAWGGASFFLSIASPAIITLLILTAPLSNTRKFIEQYFIETLRSMGQVLWWGLLFIVPGFIRYLQLLLVPFVVTLDPAYSQGKKDALSESSRIVKANFGKVIGIALLFAIILPLFMTVFDDWKVVSEHPITAFIYVIAEMTLTICMILLMRRIWEKNNGTYV